MKEELIKISKEFKGIVGGLWLGSEVTVNVDSDEELIEAYIKKHELLERVWMRLNPQINWSVDYGAIQKLNPSQDAGEFSFNQKTGTITTSPTKDERIQSFIATINMCTSLKFLENFKKRVDEENNKELTTAYNEKWLSFQVTNPTINNL